MKKIILFVFLLSSMFSFSQTENNQATAFERITKEITNFKLDTSTAPDDKITRKINELRALKGGFNIEEAIKFKIEEDKQKGDLKEADATKLSNYFLNGEGKRKLDNAVIWIYRNRFSYKELNQMTKFYKTSAGQKMAEEFPVIMLQSLAAAQIIKDGFAK